MKIIYFYKYNREQIIQLFREFIEEDFFSQYPMLGHKLSLIITGSVAHSNYDKYSDIDAEFFFVQEKDRESLQRVIKAYKKTLRERKIPIQFHPSKSFEEIKKFIKNWEADDALREYARSLIIFDPDNRFKKLQKQFRWYPKAVLKEKINWLFAEAVFELIEHYNISVSRKNKLYAAASKQRIINLLGNATLVSEGKWPCFEKHLYANLKQLPAKHKSLLQLIDKSLQETNLAKSKYLLESLLTLTEKSLIKKRLIKKQENDYWLLLRPKYKVEV